MRVVVVVAVAGMMPGCQFSRPADVPGDAAIDAPTDGPTDARPDLVAGTLTFGHRTAAGVVERGVDLTAVRVQALLVDSSAPGGYRSVAGMGRADGSFEILGVPAGEPYVLNVANRYYATSLHQVVLRSELPTRADAQTAQNPTPVTLDLAGSMLAAADDVRVISMNVGVVCYAELPGSDSDFRTADWMAGAAATYEFAPHLPSASAGDDLQVVAYRADSGTSPRDATVHSIVGSLDVSDSSIVDGVARTISGVLTPPARTLVPNFSVSRGAFGVGYDETLSIGDIMAGVYALPVLGSRWLPIGAFVPGPAICSSTSFDAQVTNQSLSIVTPCRDPFPAPWPRVGYARYVRRRWVAVPGLQPVPIDGGSTRMLELTQTLVPPPLAPPTNVKVNGAPGKDGGGFLRGPTSVEVAWSPSPGALQYMVSVFALGGLGGRTLPRFVGVMITESTNVTLPPELLTGSEYFVFAVASFAGTNDVAGGRLYPDGIPAGSAATVTGVFRINETCGNAVVDLGEECDGGGVETVTCDRDCTIAVCGDGVRNTAAGELCDPIADTPACDSDCTPVSCGDGHRNLDVEECDDGGRVDGDGCSSNCYLE
ncbi:MAG: hypothetical protein R3B06_19550 [Kofleriaceae bacterium]